MTTNTPELLSVQKIWSYAKHNAMTDLIYYKNHWFCTFREGVKHVGGEDGTIRLIVSHEGEIWESAAHLKVSEVDLRDPKLSIHPDGRLMLLVGGTVYAGDRYVYRQPRVSFSTDGFNWSPFHLILSPHEWLWRITWHEGVAYGVSYSYSDVNRRKEEWNIKLFKSFDGLNYEQIIQWPIVRHPNETTLRFLENDQMIALVRRDGPVDKSAWIGLSYPPYTNWTWNPTHAYLGGPNFIVLPDQRMFAAGRILILNPYGFYAKTILAEMNEFDFNPLIVLPSFGDCSYPGLVFHEGVLWMSYYSSHEQQSSIYLAKFKL